MLFKYASKVLQGLGSYKCCSVCIYSLNEDPYLRFFDRTIVGDAIPTVLFSVQMNEEDIFSASIPVVSFKKVGCCLRAAIKMAPKVLIMGSSLWNDCVLSVLISNTVSNHIDPSDNTLFHCNPGVVEAVIVSFCPFFVGIASALAPSSTKYSAESKSFPWL